MSRAELRGQSLTSFPGNLQEVRVAGHAGAISAAWSGRMLAPGGRGTGFASQAWVFHEFGEPSEDLRDPERGQGESLAHQLEPCRLSPTSPLHNQTHLTLQWCLINVTVIHRGSVSELERHDIIINTPLYNML